jgi:hypothetical protein
MINSQARTGNSIVSGNSANKFKISGWQLAQDSFQRWLLQGNNAEGFCFDYIIARILSRECRKLFVQADHKLAPSDGP